MAVVRVRQPLMGCLPCLSRTSTCSGGLQVSECINWVCGVQGSVLQLGLCGARLALLLRHVHVTSGQLAQNSTACLHTSRTICTGPGLSMLAPYRAAHSPHRCVCVCHSTRMAGCGSGHAQQMACLARRVSRCVWVDERWWLLRPPPPARFQCQ